jgi:superfamily II DNA or RNA helicase
MQGFRIFQEAVAMEVCGLREGFSLRDYQTLIVSETLKEFEEKSRQNVFISLPQGTGKTIIALAALFKLINENKVKKVLVLIPRRVLVNQWVDKAQEMFYGLGLIKNPTNNISYTTPLERNHGIRQNKRHITRHAGAWP